MDYLKEDPVISGQRLALVSLLTPQNGDLIAAQEKYFAKHFISQYLVEYNKASAELKKNKNIEKNIKSALLEKVNLSYENISASYDTFINKNHTQLSNDFNAKYNEADELIVHGIKIRGIFTNKLQMEEKIKELHLLEPWVDIYVTNVGKWTPYFPRTTDTVTEEYAEDKLNKYMRRHQISCNKKDEIFSKRLDTLDEKDDCKNT